MVEDIWIIIGVVAFVVGLYVLLKSLDKKPANKKFHKELQEILTKEEYKVKGRHE